MYFTHMSTRSYSTDLRERVIEHIKEGGSQKSASTILKISLSAIGRWWSRYKKEGTIAPKKRKGSKGKIKLDVLNEYIQSNANQTLAKVGAHFNVSAAAICKRLKQLGYSYKKNRIPMWKLTRKNENPT